MLDDYRRCWRNPEMIHGSCSDYRAAVTVDLEHDTADLGTKVRCPMLALWGSDGLMHGCFDIAATWRQRCENLTAQSLSGGHFFVDQLPSDTALALMTFLEKHT
jgi:haloacetate dehalogenase